MNEQQRKAMELALEALVSWGKGFPDNAGDLDREAISALKESLAQPEHDLYTDEDKNKTDAICDRNGQVALAMCKRCRKAEVELDGPCVEAQPEQEPGDLTLAYMAGLSRGKDLATQRQPLTRGQIREIEVDVSLNQSFDYITPAEQFCRAIEAAHGIKE